MKLQKISDFINGVKAIPDIQSQFDYIGYEIPKNNTAGRVLVISDITGGGLCVGADYIQLRIIGKVDGTALKVKFLRDLVNDKIISYHNLGFSNIIFDDESSIMFNNQDRFEQIITYRVY